MEGYDEVSEEEEPQEVHPHEELLWTAVERLEEADASQSQLRTENRELKERLHALGKPKCSIESTPRWDVPFIDKFILKTAI